MFGRKKREAMEELKALLVETKRGQGALQKAQGEQTEAFQKLQGKVTELWDRLEELRKESDRQLKRHSEAIEDMLEENKAQEAAVEQYEHQIREAEKRENALLSLVCQYQEDFSLLEAKLGVSGSDQGWAEQFALFRRALAGELKQCAMEETGAPGEAVDYRCHEILEVVDTDEEGLDNTVARMYRPGCIYHGQVVRKAQVAAYKGRREGI